MKILTIQHVDIYRCTYNNGALHSSSRLFFHCPLKSTATLCSPRVVFSRQASEHLGEQWFPTKDHSASQGDLWKYFGFPNAGGELGTSNGRWYQPRRAPRSTNHPTHHQLVRVWNRSTNQILMNAWLGILSLITLSFSLVTFHSPSHSMTDSIIVSRWMLTVMSCQGEH